MRYASVCSGIEAPSAAWEPLGWEGQFYSEIEPFPSAVLKHHYPLIPNLGDMTKLGDKLNDYIGNLDVFIGGTPCQSFSIAGLRGGLGDSRGNLALEFMRIINRLEPRWVVWENVPGVLSSGGGRDFGSIIGALEELGYGWAYRTLDAQFFGVPQRRRRVFLVGHIGGDFYGPRAVLFERDSMLRDSAPRQRKGQSSASPLGSGTDSPVYHSTGRGQWSDGAGSIRATGGGGTDNQPIAISYGIRAGNTSSNGWGIQEEQSHSIDTAGPQRVAEIKAYSFDCRNHRAQEEISGTLQTKENGGYSLNFQNPVVQLSVQENQRAELLLNENMPSLKGTIGGKPGQGYPAIMEVTDEIACNVESVYTDEIAQTVNSRDYKGPSSYMNGTIQACQMVSGRLRRLTPLECERLQGFPDYYTLVPYGKKGLAPDTPRYKAIGNSMAVPVIQWIGQGIEYVDALIKELGGIL